MRNFNTFRKLALLLAGFYCAAACAAVSHDEDTRYLPQRYGPSQGLTGGSVNAIAQSSDGYLWIATDQTLWRFDSQSLTPVMLNSTFGPVTHVISLTVDKQGALWIRRVGQTLIRYQHGVFSAVPWSLKMESGVTAISPAFGVGVVASALNHGIGRSDGEVFEQLASSPQSVILSLAQTSDRTVWLGTNGAGLLSLKGKTYAESGVKLPDSKVNCLLTGENGDLWIGTDHGLALWKHGQLSTRTMPEPLGHAQVLAMILDRHSNLWVGTAQGLFRYDAGKASRVSSPMSGEGLSGAVTALFEDREGNIWAGDSLGLVRWRENAFESLSKPGLAAQSDRAVAVDAAGRTWVAPATGGVYWLRNGTSHRVSVDHLDSDVVYSIATVGVDDVWLGRQHGGLTHLRLAGDIVEAKTYTQKDGLAQDSIYTVFADHEGGIWAGSITAGVSYFKDRRFVTYNNTNGLSSNTVSAFEETNDGTMWFATADGLDSLKGGKWQTYLTPQGLTSPNVTTLFRDQKGMLWVGTEDGLCRFDSGRLQPVYHLPDLLHHAIYGITEDDTGSLWIKTSQRLLREKRTRLLATQATDEKTNEFTPTDRIHGMQEIRRDRPLIGDFGQIWVVTDAGLSVITPKLLDESSVPSIVHTEGITIDGSPVDASSHLSISPGKHRISFSYVGLNFAAPERVYYRYRLDDFDRDWSTATNLREATYTNLPPGSYRFRALATNSEGQWNGAEEALSITIEPLIWQTNRFRFIALGAIVILAFLTYRLRIRQITRRVAVGFQGRMDERTRIAQELHDTLLQGFFSASLQLNTATNQVPHDSPSRATLERVQILMDRVIDEGRNAVSGLRATDLPASTIEQNFNKMLEEMAGMDDIRCHIVVKGTSRPLHSVIYGEVYRIGREALINSLRHARCRQIEVKVQYSAKQLKIDFSDDGGGIEPEVLQRGRGGHWGLAGMRERATKIGAKLEFWSNASTGTRVSLTIPEHLAFRRPSKKQAGDKFMRRLFVHSGDTESFKTRFRKHYGFGRNTLRRP